MLGACFHEGSYEITGNLMIVLDLEGHWHGGSNSKVANRGRESWLLVQLKPH